MAFGLKMTTPASNLATFQATPAPVDLVYEASGLSYRLTGDSGAYRHALTDAASIGDVLSLGWRLRWDDASAAMPLGFFSDFGLIVRPANFVSLAIGFIDATVSAATPAVSYTFGAAIRPLAFDPRLESMLTLSADASYKGDAFSFDTIGARFALDSWLSVSGRYSIADSSFGLGVSLALSGTEASAGYGLAAGAAPASDGVVDIGAAIRFGRAAKPATRIFAKSVLVIDEPGVFAGVPPRMEFDVGIGDKQALWFGQAIAAIDKAATDRSIGYLVMIEPPLFESEARAQEFGRAIDRFKKAGKPVYVYARAMDRLSYIYAAAGAELIAIDPNGSLPLIDVASFSPYLKGLFDKLGIDIYNLQSHETKTAYNIFSESGMTAAERAMVKRYVDGLAAQGYAALGAARGPKLKGSPLDAIGKGPYLDPRTAVEAGLVDALMYRDEFDDAVKEKTGGAQAVDIRGYARERGLSWGAPLGKKVAVVYLSGNIIEDEGVAGVSIGESAAELLAALREDFTVSGVILRVDSGGGSALTSDHIAREVKKLKDAGKHVVVSMAGYAASGGYYISAYADKILAEAGTITGSIGVTGMSFSMVRMLEKIGVGTGSVSASPSGQFGNPFLPHREGDSEVLRSGIDYIYGRFVDVVAEGRKLDKAKVDELGKGQIWLGSEAVANGLVDAIGGLDDAKAAMSAMLGSAASFVNYLPGDMDMGPFAGMMESAASAIVGVSPSGAVSEAVGDALGFIDELSSMGDGLLYLAPEYLYRQR